MTQIILPVVSASLFKERISSSYKQFQKLRWELRDVLITDWSDTTAALLCVEL